MSIHMDRPVVGLVESVLIMTQNGGEQVSARVDTGATKSSIDQKLATRLQLGPLKGSQLIKSAHGHSFRPILEITLNFKGKLIKSSVTVADRSHMQYPLLIGQDILKTGNFLVDPCR